METEKLTLIGTALLAKLQTLFEFYQFFYKCPFVFQNQDIILYLVVLSPSLLLICNISLVFLCLSPGNFGRVLIS